MLLAQNIPSKRCKVKPKRHTLNKTKPIRRLNSSKIGADFEFVFYLLIYIMKYILTDVFLSNLLVWGVSLQTQSARPNFYTSCVLYAQLISNIKVYFIHITYIFK